MVYLKFGNKCTIYDHFTAKPIVDYKAFSCDLKVLFMQSFLYEIKRSHIVHFSSQF